MADPTGRAAKLASITPAHSAKTYEQVHAEERTIRLQTPDVGPGDIAPDFELDVVDFSSGERRETTETFHLQSVAANTPVALVFGSYT